MNYRHAYHAGNFADVLKHAALADLLTRLRVKDAPLLFIDTHAGRGLYDLKSAEAAKTKEAEGGILKLLDDPSFAALMNPYAKLARKIRDTRKAYPGSPLLAAELLSAKDKIAVIEKHPEEFKALAALFARDKRVRAVEGDGYAELKHLLPPPRGQAVVLIDPPYEDNGEFKRATRALLDAYVRAPAGIFLLWYPAKERAVLAATMGELLNAAVPHILKLELDVGGESQSHPEARGPRLSAAGLLVVNPPPGFAEAMRLVLPYLAGRLALSARAGYAVQTVAE